MCDNINEDKYKRALLNLKTYILYRYPEFVANHWVEGFCEILLRTIYEALGDEDTNN